MDVSITEVNAWPEKYYTQAKELYERSFPIEERNDFDQLLNRGPVSDRPRMLISTDEDKLLGFSIFRPFAQASLGYLWYLCVDENTRGMGIGAKLYKQSVDLLQEGQSLKGMIFEVERLDSEPHDLYGDPIRRVRFYERLGARLILGYDYWQPPIPPHGPVPLQLMFHPLGLQDCTQDDLACIVSDFLHYGQGMKDVPVDPSDLRLGSAE